MRTSDLLISALLVAVSSAGPVPGTNLQESNESTTLEGKNLIPKAATAVGHFSVRIHALPADAGPEYPESAAELSADTLTARAEGDARSSPGVKLSETTDGVSNFFKLIIGGMDGDQEMEAAVVDKRKRDHQSDVDEPYSQDKREEEAEEADNYYNSHLESRAEADEHEHMHEKRLNSVVISWEKLSKSHWKWGKIPVPDF